MFLPTTAEELRQLRWGHPDIILVSGDAYIDCPYDGVAVVGKVLLNNGYKVAIISQPDINSGLDITRLGSPKLFWGVSAGCVDSMVANYTALKKKKHSDDLTPGGKNGARPDRASIVYTNLIKKYYKNPAPIILGGIEASMRRIAHYDYWSDSLMASILIDSKADALVYGMGEKTILEIAEKIKNKQNWKDTRGISYIGQQSSNYKYINLPSFEEVKSCKKSFISMFNTFYKNCDPFSAKGLIQNYNDVQVIQNPPQILPSSKELDNYYDIDFMRDAHPFYKNKGEIKSLETIRFSITTHRGCYGECNFCSIAMHQGRRIISRSEKSIVNEALEISKMTDFKGYISDVGGPTANMYNNECGLNQNRAMCPTKSCTFPNVCKQMDIDHKPQIDLLKKIEKIDGVKKVFVNSGVRYDLVVEDKKNGLAYLDQIVEHNVSGQMKVAPEHNNPKVLAAMRKNSKYLILFKKMFDELNRKKGKKQFLTYYFMAAHPGCGINEMNELASFLKKEIGISPEQAQIFTPTPSTYSTLMYYTGMDPFTMENIFVEKNQRGKQVQKDKITNAIRKNNFRGKPIKQSKSIDSF